MSVLIGTSGWQYNHWKERFYPRGVAQRRWLEHYAERFQTVESNNAFYMLPKPETFASWAARTPDDFVMAVKANRYLTHIRRLREPREPVERFMASAKRLGKKFGPVLLQLPPNLKADLNALDQTLRSFRGRVRVAVEFRHDTWFSDETRSLLEQHGAALCMADRGSKPITALWRTADWTYLRFHEGAASPSPCYGRTSLRTWAERLAEEWGPEADIWVYFNNDPGGCALRDARIFAREVARAGLTPTRVPPETIPVD
ncbi:MAG: DUF72 domain-containing protein [Actinomycetota bacterium]|nr:DUF72 domain-containing protein [Actinomycetota bacterium]